MNLEFYAFSLIASTRKEHNTQLTWGEGVQTAVELGKHDLAGRYFRYVTHELYIAAPLLAPLRPLIREMQADTALGSAQLCASGLVTDPDITFGEYYERNKSIRLRVNHVVLGTIDTHSFFAHMPMTLQAQRNLTLMLDGIRDLETAIQLLHSP